MAMEVFDCPVCSAPLRPPVFQCTLGHFVCSPCCDKLPDGKCQTCSGAVLKSSCYGMERIVESILVPCPYAEHGCTDMITYYLKGEHKEVCPHEPCYCPEPGCGFAGTTATLLDHFTSQHKWLMTVFKYYVPFHLTAKPGMHVLRAQDGNLFLLNVSSPELTLHGISTRTCPAQDLGVVQVRMFCRFLVLDGALPALVTGRGHKLVTVRWAA